MRQRLMIAFGIVGLCLGLIGLFAHYHSPGSLYTLALSTFSSYLGLGALAGAVLFALARTPAGWIGCGACVLVVGWFVVLKAPGYVADPAPDRGTDVVVMTSNLKVGAADASAVVAAVRARHVDVLMLEELTPDIAVRLRSGGLDDLLPHSVADPQHNGAGTGLWSRYPLSHTQVRRDFGFSFVSARVTGRMTMAAVHVFGPYPAAQFPRWHDDMRRYPAVLGALPGPTVLIGGDFNATTDDAQFRGILGNGFADAAQQAGAGFTPTWPTDRWYPPLITIDHVLTRNAVARSLDSVEIPGSDHRALVVSVRLPI